MKKIKLVIWSLLLALISAIRWNRTQAVFNNGIYYSLKEGDHDIIRQLLSKNYLIILTRRKSHLATYLVSFASLFIERKFSYYSHVLMNVEGDLDGHIGFKLIEATGRGVHYSTFMEVFDCDSVALLAPKGISIEEWTKVLDHVKSSLGKQYDTLFDITNNESVSCVELVYWGLMELPDFETRFPNLIKLIRDHKNNLTPQMLYDTGELDVVYEVRR